MGATRIAVALSCLVLPAGCIDELLGEEPCGGNEKEPHVVNRDVPEPPVTGGDFYTAIEGDRRLIRHTAYFENVCSEEHVTVKFLIDVDPLYSANATAQGDVTPFPLFGDEVELTLEDVEPPGRPFFRGTLELGLKQWYEGGPGEFGAGVQIWLPASVPESELGVATQLATFDVPYRAAPGTAAE
jgi:hypothetical protein